MNSYPTQEIIRSVMKEASKRFAESYEGKETLHCSICGDTPSLCHLVRVNVSDYLCKDCIEIQKNMYDNVIQEYKETTNDNQMNDNYEARFYITKKQNNTQTYQQAPKSRKRKKTKNKKK